MVDQNPYLFVLLILLFFKAIIQNEVNQYVALRGTSRRVYHYKSEFTLHDTETPQVQDLSELWPWRG